MIPEINRISDIEVLKSEQHSSKFGVKLHAINAPAVDVIRLSLVFRAGLKHQQFPFQASATASMLSEGCGELTSHQVAEMLDFYGIYYDVSVDRDYSIITICALDKFLDKALELLKKIVTEPLFPQNEFEVYCSKRQAAIKLEREKVDVKGREAFISALYGENHPYGTFFDGKLYNDLTTDKLKSFFTTFYNRSNMFAVMSGKVSNKAIEASLFLLDSIHDGQVAKNFEELPLPKPTTVTIPVKDSVQSSLRIGRVMFDRSHPDFVPMQLLCTLLGGYFSSRLMSSLREDKGYTYGAYSGIANIEQSGYFAISSEVEGSVTWDAVELIFTQLKRVQTELVEEQELEMVKRVMLGEILRILDGPFGIADVTIENIQNGKTNHYTEDMIKEINKITAKQVQQMACKYLNREQLTVIVAGVTERR